MEILCVLPDHVDDDLVALNTAREYNGFIISNDKFRNRLSDARFTDVLSRVIAFKYEHIDVNKVEISENSTQ